MSADPGELETLRAELERTLEETRAQWRNGGGGKSPQPENTARVRRANGHRFADAASAPGERDIEVVLPRSKLFRTVKKHPVAAAAAIAAVWYLIGPARVGALARGAAGTLVRNSRLIPPLVKGLALIRSGH